jgi:hypothetical protein
LESKLYEDYKKKLKQVVVKLVAYAQENPGLPFSVYGKRFAMNPGQVGYYLHKAGHPLRKPGRKPNEVRD